MGETETMRRMAQVPCEAMIETMRMVRFATVVLAVCALALAVTIAIRPYPETVIALHGLSIAMWEAIAFVLITIEALCAKLLAMAVSSLHETITGAAR